MYCSVLCAQSKQHKPLNLDKKMIVSVYLVMVRVILHSYFRKLSWLWVRGTVGPSVSFSFSPMILVPHCGTTLKPCFKLFKQTSCTVFVLKTTVSFISVFSASYDVAICCSFPLVLKWRLSTTISIYRGSGVKSCSHLSLSGFISIQWCLSFFLDPWD